MKIQTENFFGILISLEIRIRVAIIKFKRSNLIYLYHRDMFNLKQNSTIQHVGPYMYAIWSIKDKYKTSFLYSVYSVILWFRWFYDAVHSCAISTNFQRHILNLTTTVPQNSNNICFSIDEKDHHCMSLPRKYCSISFCNIQLHVNRALQCD